MERENVSVVRYNGAYKAEIAETKRRLNAARSAQSSIVECVCQMEQLHDLRTRVTSVIRECTSAGGAMSDSRAEATARLVDMEERLYRDIQRYESANCAVIAELNTLKSEKQRAVLHRRYILGWSWDKIADDLQLGKDAVFRLHGRALYNLSRLHACDKQT